MNVDDGLLRDEKLQKKKKTGVGTLRWNKSRPDWPKSDRKGQVTWLSAEGARTKY